MHRFRKFFSHLSDIGEKLQGKVVYWKKNFTARRPTVISLENLYFAIRDVFDLQIKLGKEVNWRANSRVVGNSLSQKLSIDVISFF